jgi:hypothetical protein
MKKSILLALFAITITSTTLKAQQVVAAPVQQQAPNALSKLAVLKLASVGFPNDLLGTAYPIFSEYYTNLQAYAAGEAAALAIKRDEKLKLIFTEAQMATWKNTVEPALLAGQ